MIVNQDMFSLEGKTALITGATGYLGEFMSFALAGLGAHILVNGRNGNYVNKLVEKLVDNAYHATSLVFDVCDEKSVSQGLSVFKDSPIHIIVNNAYSGTQGSQEYTSSDDYLKSYSSSVVASQFIFNCCLNSLRLAVNETGDASVINIASMYGMVSPDLRVYGSATLANPPQYGAAKAGLIQLTKYLAVQYGPEKIRVNCLSPGPFPNPINKVNSADFIDRLAYKVPLWRVGFPNEIQGPLAFLASPAASFVNGANLVVDGGWTAC